MSPGVVAVYRVPQSTGAGGRWYVPDTDATSGRDGEVASIAVLADQVGVANAMEAYRVDPRLQWDESEGNDLEVTQLS
ncbi:MAG: hypothetical protein ACRDWD_11640, partial [Acidimicrobiia bacterium]